MSSNATTARPTSKAGQELWQVILIGLQNLCFVFFFYLFCAEEQPIQACYTQKFEVLQQAMNDICDLA